jgi:hypothetical protein
MTERPRPEFQERVGADTGTLHRQTSQRTRLRRWTTATARRCVCADALPTRPFRSETGDEALAEYDQVAAQVTTAGAWCAVSQVGELTRATVSHPQLASAAAYVDGLHIGP